MYIWQWKRWSLTTEKKWFNMYKWPLHQLVQTLLDRWGRWWGLCSSPRPRLISHLLRWTWWWLWWMIILNDKLLRRNDKDLKSCPVFSARGPGPVVQLLWGQLSFKAAFNIVIIINNINIITIIIVTIIISTSITISTTTTAHQVREEFNADTFSRGEQCQVQVQI